MHTYMLGHERLFGICCESDWQAEIFCSSFFGEIGSRYFLDGARLALICRRRASAAASGERQRFLSDVFMKIHETWPNKSLEPTPVTPSVCREVTRWRMSSSAWLSFLR